VINIHELKTYPEYFRAVWKGNKTFEVRRNDRDFKQGDGLLLKEWDPETGEYSGVWICKRITYILNDPGYCKEGFVILGLK
jgi:hypothetical protein